MYNSTLKSIGISSGRALLRHSVVVLTDEERVLMEERLAEEQERRQRLERAYVQQKMENELRSRLEAEREKVLFHMLIVNDFRKSKFVINNFWKSKCVWLQKLSTWIRNMPTLRIFPGTIKRLLISHHRLDYSSYKAYLAR